MVYASYQLWLDYQPNYDEYGDEIEQIVIGSVVDVDQNVKRKKGDSLLWDPLKPGDAVYNQDSIRTGLNSATELKLNDSSSISLEENSLVVLDSNDQAFNIDFKTGEFKTNSVSKNLQIKVKDSVLSAKQAQINIKTRSDQDTEIQVTKGTASLQGAGGQQISLDTQKAAKIDKLGRAEALKVKVILSSPENRTEVLNPLSQMRYPFTWAALSSDLKREIFQISTRPDFPEGPETKQKWAHQATEEIIQRGDNFWRVGWYSLDPKTKKQKIEFSPTRKISLLNDERVQLLFPENASTFTQSPGNTEIDFRWRSKNSAKLFVFEISNRADFRQIIINQRTNQTEYKVKDLDSGIYYWRVSAYGNANKAIGQSKVNKVIVEKIIPRGPELIYPRNNFVWSMPESLRFEWQKYPTANYYQWTISSDRYLKKIVKTMKLKALAYDWRWLTAGEYYWRVKAFNAQGTLVAESETHLLNIDQKQSSAAIALIDPKDQSEVVVENLDPLPAISFQWQPKEALSPNYEVYVSKTSAFTSAVKFESKELTRIKAQLKEEGVYFWKVRWVNPENPKDIKESVPFSFRLSKNKNLPAPELLEPDYDTELELYRDEEVSFKWQEISSAKSYRFILKRKIGENTYKTIVDRNTKEPSTNKANLVPGDYIWFVHAIDASGIQGLKAEERGLKVIRDKGLAPPVLNPVIIK